CLDLFGFYSSGQVYQPFDRAVLELAVQKVALFGLVLLLTSGAYRKNVTHDADHDVLRVDTGQFSADDEVSILDKGLQRRRRRGGPTIERPVGLGPQIFKYLIEAMLEVVEIAKRTP